ncbi:MAG: hypothetical protein QM760_08945 [Nibricoccus sp.]
MDQLIHPSGKPLHARSIIRLHLLTLLHSLLATAQNLLFPLPK